LAAKSAIRADTLKRGLHNGCVIGLLALGDRTERAHRLADRLHLLLPHDLRFLGNGNGHTETADCDGESEGLEAHAVISLLRRGAALMMRRNMAASAAGTK